jgi:hypothetical protein
VKRTFSISPKRLLVLGALAITGALTVGFAAANTMPASTNAGDGSVTVSGYTVSAVHYTLNSSTPNLTTQVSFTLAPPLPAGGTQRLSLDGGTTWITCTGTSSIQCNAAVAVSSLTSLRVVAAD